MAVYFVQAEDGGPIKIGFSDNVEKRIKTLQADYGRKLVILATIEGDRARERAVHAQFKHLRFKGREQFRPGPDLMEFIGRPYVSEHDIETVKIMKHPGPPAFVDIKITVDYPFYRDASWEARLAGVSLTEYVNDLLGSGLVDLLAEKIRSKPKKYFR